MHTPPCTLPPTNDVRPCAHSGTGCTQATRTARWQCGQWRGVAAALALFMASVLMGALLLPGLWLPVAWTPDAAQAATLQPEGAGEWRLRIREAAVTTGDTVLLGDIADPYGPLSESEWKKLASRALWSAPKEEGKPLQISKVRLAQALRERLGDLADRCLLPSNMAIQRGGSILYEDALRALVVKTLTPALNTLHGQPDFSEFRLPAYIFLTHAGQQVEIEPFKPAAGRVNLRFVVKEVDGSVVRRFTGSTFINLWAEVACAAVPYNRGDVLTPDGVTWIRKNLAHVRGDLWDGRGGPWQVLRAIGTGQPIFMTDIEPKSVIRKGAIVNLIFEKGSVRLSTQAEALADGSLGDTIAVRNLQSKKQVFATVRDSDTVVIK